MPFIHETPPCKRCGSIATGRYLISNDQEDGIRYLQHGEYIRPCSEVPMNNLFCTECGMEWTGPVKFRYMSRAELNDRKKIMGITKDGIREKEQELTASAVVNRRTNKYLEAGGKALSWFTNTMFIAPVKSIKKDISSILKEKQR